MMSLTMERISRNFVVTFMLFHDLWKFSDSLYNIQIIMSATLLKVKQFHLPAKTETRFPNNSHNRQQNGQTYKTWIWSQQALSK